MLRYFFLTPIFIFLCQCSAQIDKEPFRPTNFIGEDFHASWSPDGWIVFDRNENNIRDIYIIRPDGTRERRLTKDNGVNDHPRWFPDGKHILFESDRNTGREDLYSCALSFYCRIKNRF